MKSVFALTAALALSGCVSSTLSPEDKAAVQANIERNRVDPATKQQASIGSQNFSITQNASRKVAMVVGVPGVSSADDMIAAVEQNTGCKAAVMASWPQATGLSTSSPIPADTYRQFGGKIPILTNC